MESEELEQEVATPAEEVTDSETVETGEPSQEVNPEVAKIKEVTQKRINQITREKYQERQKREELERRLAELEKKQAETAIVQKPVPKLEDFESHEEFVKAVADYSYANNRAKDEIKTRQDIEAETAKKTKEQTIQNFEKQAKDARGKYKDFDEVALSDIVPYSDASRQLVLSSEVSGELSYYLGKNLDEAEKIASMNPLDAAKAIGKLEIKLTHVSKKAISDAPTPIEPIHDGKDILKKDPSKMTIDEWMAWDRAKSMAKLKEKYGG